MGLFRDEKKAAEADSDWISEIHIKDKQLSRESLWANKLYCKTHPEKAFVPQSPRARLPQGSERFKQREERSGEEVMRWEHMKSSGPVQKHAQKVMCPSNAPISRVSLCRIVANRHLRKGSWVIKWLPGPSLRDLPVSTTKTPHNKQAASGQNHDGCARTLARFTAAEMS